MKDSLITIFLCQICLSQDYFEQSFKKEKSILNIQCFRKDEFQKQPAIESRPVIYKQEVGKNIFYETYDLDLHVIYIFLSYYHPWDFLATKIVKTVKTLTFQKNFQYLTLSIPTINPRPIETTFNPHIKAQFTPSKNIFQEFSQNYHAACDSLKKKWNQWMDTPQIKDAKKWKIRLTEDYYKPFNRVYRSLPERLTQFKFENFGNYEFKERLFGLEALTLLVAICTFNHRKAQFLPINRLLFATRNSAVTYLLGGLLVAPEIYNPLLKRDL